MGKRAICWVVERTLSWLLGCRRLGIRYERRADLLQGLLHLACTLICLRFLGPRGG
jgi:transposase